MMKSKRETLIKIENNHLQFGVMLRRNNLWIILSTHTIVKMITIISFLVLIIIITNITTIITITMLIKITFQMDLLQEIIRISNFMITLINILKILIIDSKTIEMTQSLPIKNIERAKILSLTMMKRIISLQIEDKRKSGS